MARLRLLSLVTLLLAIVSCCFADEYQPLTVQTPQTATLQPCEFSFWQVDTSASNSVNNYLSVNVLSNVSSSVVVSTTEYSGWLKLSSTNATGYSQVGANVTLDVVCTYLTATTWFITIGNNAGVPISYTVVASIFPVPITPLTLNMVTYNPRATGYQRDTYVDLYDVYSLSLPQTASLGQTLIVDITSPVPVNVLYNTGALAANYGDNVCYNAMTATTTLTINYCTYKSLVAQSPNAYIAITPQVLTTTPTAYSLNVTTPAPSVKVITPGAVTLDFVTPGQIKYYSFPVANNTNGVVVNAHIQNVEGGSVDFSYQFGELPFTSCLGYTCTGDTPSCCVDVDVGCQLVVNSCFIQDGTYYLGVTGSSFDSPQQPIVFEIIVNVTGVPSVSSVKDGEFITATVSQSQYNHYMLEDSDSDDDGYLEFHLYVDQSNSQSSEVIMYVNYDGYAGSNGDSCYSSVAQCSVGSVGACTIQINPCLFDEHTNWYASVYAGSYSDLNQKGQQYTLSATILNPVELEEPSVVLHSVLYPGTFDHYSIDEDLLPEGGGFFLVVNAVNGGQVNVYQNIGGLAGPLDTCPTCYNYTDYRSTSQRLVWPVMNCNSTTDEDKDDYYFSVMSNNAPGGELISYSITVVKWEELDPSDDLENGKVLVDFVGANAANNYTVESSSGSDSYLVITLTQVDVYSASQFVPLTLSLVNTTNANCADSTTYSASCTLSSSTYECSIVVQQCDLTTSDGFVAFVNNYNNQLSAHYNLYYETYKATPVDLVNGQSFAGSVMNSTYQMFSYESTGSDTLIIEVFFDKTCTTIEGGACEGQLFVTTDKPNADKCIPITEAEYYMEDSTKCVFALTTCSLPEEIIYFAVSTRSDLHANYPLSFTAKVTEMSSTIAVQPLHPTQAALYPRQKNYHTFTTTANAPTSFTTLDVVVNSVQNGQVVAVLAEDTQANETCECFEFVDQLKVEYCDITSPNWAALVQSVPGSNTPANQLIEYTITVGQFVNAPMALPISTAYPPTPTYGSLVRGQYAYYQLALTNPPSTPLVLSVTNVANGVLTIYYSTTPNQPATRTCGGGRTVATGVSGVGGSWPLGSCETTDSLPTYITILAASTTDFKNVTYSVSLLNVPLIAVTTQPSIPQALPAGFTRDYQATLDLSTSVAPMVTFYVENVTSQRSYTFQLVISNTNTCESSAALHTITCPPNSNCSISISDCGIKASNTFYLVITSTTNTNYTVRVELVDLAATSIPLTLAQDSTTTVYSGSASTQVSAGSFPWVTFTITVPDAPGYSLELDVTSDGNAGSFYSSFQEATPNCYIPSLSRTNSFNAITQNACCSQAGALSVAVYTAVAATITLDVTMTPVILSTITLPATNAASSLVQNQTLAGVLPVVMPFSTQTVPYASVYMAVTLADDSDDVYFKQGSPAGPTQGSGGCLGSDFSCTRQQPGGVCYYNVPQCFTSGEPFQNPAAYYAGVDSGDATTFNVTYGLAPYNAVNAGVQGSYTYVPAQPVYVTFTATGPSVEIDVSINVTYTDNAAQVYIYSGQCEQGTPLYTCAGSPCLFQTPSCSILSDDFLVVVHTQSTTVGGTVTVDAGMMPNTIAYTAQSLDNGAVVAVSGNTNNYVTATVSKATATQYSELLISNYTGSPTGLTVYWTVQGQHLCFTEITFPVVCEAQQDLTYTCTAILSSCELTDGLYYFNIDLSSSTATAQVSFVGLQTENTIPITTLPAVQAGSVLANQRITYSIELDVLVPQAGQSVEFSLNDICGDTSLYLYGDDNLCPVSSGKSYTIDKCALLNSSVVNNQVNTLYFSVNGDAQAYPNSPARFVFEVALQGEPIAFVPVGTNELITYVPNTVWVFPISGINDFVGQLQIVYGKGASGNLVISFDVPTFCASPSETITLNSTFLYLNSCTIDKYRQVYISFADGSDGASFQITHARPFTRNLNEFTENPQTGAVSPSSNSASQTSYFVDEEYYSLEVDSTVQNFQFAAWVSDDDDPISPTTQSTVRLQSSLVEPPSMCSTSNTQNVAWNRKLTWEWCQVGDNTPIYLTVNNPVTFSGGPQAAARSYNLYFTTVLDTPPTELTANQPMCAPVMNKTTAYFHAVATSTAAAHQKIRVSSVTTLEGTGALNVYISTGGLASATCNENSDFGSQCNAGSNVCEFDLSCFAGGNISVAVVNDMTENASFYIEYISTPIQPLTITVGATTAPVIGANNGTEQTYYLSATVPALAANQWLAVSATSPQSTQTAFTLWYSVGSMPGADCYEGRCIADAGECALLVNSCTPPTANQIIYIVVQSTGQFNVWVDVVSTTLNTLTAQQRMAGSFAVADYLNADTLHSMITKPLALTYQITVSPDDIANNLLGDMTIVVDSVNQGSIANPALLVWVTPATAGYFGDDCVLDSASVSPSTPGALYVAPCQFTSGNYFVTVALNLDANLDGCTDVAFGITYSFTKANPVVTSIDNVSVSVNIPIGTSDQTFYSLSGNALTGVFVQVPNQVRFDLSYFRAPFALGASASCETYLHDSNSTDDSTITSFTHYWWGCTAHNTTSNLVLEVTGPGLMVVLPGTQYTVTGVTQAIADLTSTPASYTFGYSFLTQQVYKFSIDVDDSAEISVQLTKGPSVHVELYSSTCDTNNENVLMTAMNCYAGVCKIPISWSAGDLDNNTIYYVVVSGYAPAAYSVSLATGESGTCVEPTNTTLCDVSWTVWNYGTGEAGFGLQDSAAIRMYQTLLNSFCPPCGCTEISSKCNSSLIEYVCTQSYRACDTTGLQTSVCEDTCADVENNCGVTFAEVGLPYLSCNHNFYYTEDDGSTVCEDIYDITVTDRKDQLLWLIALVVLVLVVIIILGVVGYLGYKKYKHGRQGNSYEKIKEPSSDDEVVDEIAVD